MAVLKCKACGAALNIEEGQNIVICAHCDLQQTICEKSRSLDKVKAVLEANGSRPVPQWIDVNKDQLEAKIIALPERDQIDAPIDEQPIVEFYSK